MFSLSRRRPAAWLTALALVVGVPLATPVTAAAGPAHDTIQGTGSSWSANAVNQWVADVQQSGLRVVYTAPGSAQGRKDFSAYNSDFGVSDIGYQGSDPKTGADDTSSRPYAYLPIVAGGTAFPYQIQVGGKKITDLRLSGETLARIFTGAITNWNDDAVTKDNNGRKLPSKKIIPVVHSEGAGSTAQFTRYLATEYGSLWTPFNGNANFTEYFPAKAGMQAASGSDGVMNYITSGAGDGTIGYDEYSYALGAGYPVAKIKNAAGYYTLPTQYNVAVALTQAQINTDKSSKDYLLQNLNGVYVYNDNRTYALSSYSYAIIPTDGGDRRMTTAKRQTLADYLFYSVCGGQAEMGPIGYSALPLNLVQASFDQVAKLKAADGNVDLTNQAPANCDNPTFDKANPSANKLAETAPQPPACDKDGAGPCDANGNVTAAAGAAAGASASGAAAAGTTQTGSGPGAAAGAGATAAGATDASQVDPETGQLVGSGGGGGTGADAVPVDLAAYHANGSPMPFAILAVVLLVLGLVLPPVLALQWRRKRGTTA